MAKRGKQLPADDDAAPRTPDGRYLVVRGRLWRASNPQLSKSDRERLVEKLMDARRAIHRAQRAGDAAVRRARRAVQSAKVGLGERGAVWWKDGAPDYNWHLVKNTPYADWYASLEARVSKRAK